MYTELNKLLSKHREEHNVYNMLVIYYMLGQIEKKDFTRLLSLYSVVASYNYNYVRSN